MATYPDEYVYSREHEWISVDGDIATVGITHHAQDELGDVVFVELPEAGARFSQGEPFGTIESVKAVSDLFAPLTGEITEVNAELLDGPEVVNEDPHATAWMVRMRMDDPTQAAALLSAAEYQEFIEE